MTTKWSTTKPQVIGWYWCEIDNIGKREIRMVKVFVSEHTLRLWVYDPPYAMLLVDHKGIRYAGPIRTPEEP